MADDANEKDEIVLDDDQVMHDTLENDEIELEATSEIQEGFIKTSTKKFAIIGIIIVVVAILVIALLVFLGGSSLSSSETTKKSKKTLLGFVPVVFGGYDIMGYWNSDAAVMGSPEFAFNITKKDSYNIARIYQLHFSSSENLATFRKNPDKYLPAFGGFCGWGTCCELEPEWLWDADIQGGPSGFDPKMHGWQINQETLYFSFNTKYRGMFFSNPKHRLDAETRWGGWFPNGEGVLNYMCLSYDRPKYSYCQDYGQPLAPAVNQNEEIFEAIPESKKRDWFSDFQGV